MKIIVSSCESEQRTGDGIRNGGVRMHNDLVQLLNDNGVKAYVCTYDGKYTPWMVGPHAPHCSLAQVQEWKDAGEELKYVTTWPAAEAFLEAADKFYYYDGELKWTLKHLRRLEAVRERILGIAGICKYIQAWHMARWQTPAALISCACNQWWYPRPERRVTRRIGYMYEGPNTKHQVNEIASALSAVTDCEFFEVEKHVRDEMQTCDIFLGMFQSKYELWGQGFGLPGIEAMHCGCVPVVFDTLGNREYLIDGYNGYAVPENDVGAMIERVKHLLLNRAEKEQVRQRSLDIADNAFRLASRWPLVKEWLEL
jgi:hypothetical protein